MAGARPGWPGRATPSPSPSVPRVGRLESVPGQQRHDLVAGPDDAAAAGGGGGGQGHAAGRLRVDALEPGDIADGRPP